MLPSSARDDHIDVAAMDAVFQSGSLVVHPVGTVQPKSNYFHLGHLCHSVLRPTIACAVQYTVRLIAGWRVPSQVFNAVVVKVAVVVASLHAVWTWANERLKNEIGKHPLRGFTFTEKLHSQPVDFSPFPETTPSVVNDGTLQIIPASRPDQAPNEPIPAYSIVREARYPPPINRIVFSHDVPSHPGCLVVRDGSAVTRLAVSLIVLASPDWRQA